MYNTNVYSSGDLSEGLHRSEWLHDSIDLTEAEAAIKLKAIFEKEFFEDLEKVYQGARDRKDSILMTIERLREELSDIDDFINTTEPTIKELFGD